MALLQRFKVNLSSRVLTGYQIRECPFFFFYKLYIFLTDWKFLFQGEQVQLLECDNQRGLPPLLRALLVTQTLLQPTLILSLWSFNPLSSSRSSRSSLAAGILWYVRFLQRVTKHFSNFPSTWWSNATNTQTPSAKIDRDLVPDWWPGLWLSPCWKENLSLVKTPQLLTIQVLPAICWTRPCTSITCVWQLCVRWWAPCVSAWQTSPARRPAIGESHSNSDCGLM